MPSPGAGREAESIAVAVRRDQLAVVGPQVDADGETLSERRASTSSIGRGGARDR